jgi:hypothetical protein
MGRFYARNAGSDRGEISAKLEGLDSKIRLINHRGYGPLRGGAHRNDLPLLWRHHGHLPFR